jgi:thiol-disulfide isomerase/thioredoxin
MTLVRFLNTFLCILVFAGLTSKYCIADDLYIFSAKWCPSCVNLKKFLDDNTDLHDIYNIVIIDIDESPDLKKHFKIRVVPTTIILNDDSLEVARITGYDNSYQNRLKKLMK